jgi:hypothetical protein
MRFLTLILSLGFLLTGCKLGCEAEKIVSERLSGALATAASCSHPEEIQKDVLAVIDVANLCKAQDKHTEYCEKYQAELKQGPIAEVVCPLVTTTLVSIVGNQIPARYGCQLTSSPLSVIALQACRTLPF